MSGNPSRIVRRPSAGAATPQRPRKIGRRIALVVIAAIVVVAIGAGAAKIYAVGSKIFAGTNKSFFRQIFDLATTATTSANVPIAGQAQDRTNFLIYGLTADGLRTDTIILASYYWQEHKLVMLNIPRDLYVDDNGTFTKIVSLYAIAKDQEPGNATYPAQYVSDFIGKEYGIPIDYWAVANWAAFKDVVNSVGGVTIDVPDSFTDYEYPTDDYSGYIRPAPHFNAGVQTMDGTTALIYARSRHSLDNGEGTDFARSRRQQQIITAVLAKLEAQGVLTDTTKLNSYLNILGSNVITSISPAELYTLAKTASKLSPSQDIVTVNWSNDSGFLCDSTDVGGSYVLRYGVIGSCTGVATGTTPAGGGPDAQNQNVYRSQAISFVQNLLADGEAEDSPSPTPTP